MENSYAAQLLAAALLQLLPKAILHGEELLPYGFSYSFAAAEFHEALLPALEETMHLLMQESWPIKTMMAQNAASYFQHTRQNVLAAHLLSQKKELCELVEIHGQLFLCKYPPKEAKLAFRILKVDETVLGFRIEVAAFPTNNELKKFLKAYKVVEKYAFAKLGKELGLVEGNGWLPRGVRLRRIIEEELRRRYFHFGFEEVMGFEEPPMKRCVQFGNLDTAFCLCSRSEGIEVVTSILQFIDQIIKLFSIEYVSAFDTSEEMISADLYNHAHLLCDKMGTLRLFFNDALGQKRRGSYLSVEPHRNGLLVRFSVLGSLDHFLQVLLERYKGDLPFWLAPEQVRLLPLSQAYMKCATQMLAQLEEAHLRASIDARHAPIKERLYYAKRFRIPYVFVVGEKECATGRLCVDNEELTIDELRRRFESQQRDTRA